MSQYTFASFILSILVVATLFTPVTEVLAGGGGGGGGGGDGRSNNAYTDRASQSYSDANNFADDISRDPTSFGGRHGDRGVVGTNPNTGDITVGISQRDSEGSDRRNNRNSGGGGGRTPAPCTTNPDLTITSIGFSTEPLTPPTVAANWFQRLVQHVIPTVHAGSGSSGLGSLINVPNNSAGASNSPNSYTVGSTIAADKLDPGVVYYPYVVIKNTGCLATNADGVYSNELPFGENGSYPIRLLIDMDDTADIGDAAVNPVAYLNAQPALSSNESLTVPFNPVVLPEGTHTFEAYVDIPDSVDPGNGCTNDYGCIEEVAQDNNQYSIDATVTEPSVSLGSFQYREGNRERRRNYSCDSDCNDVDKWRYYWDPAPVLNNITSDFEHDITGYNGNVGLYWSGSKIQWNTCTGSTVASDSTTLNDFNGRKHGDWSNAEDQFGSRYDLHITEPPANTYHLYTITCQSSSGTTVSASHIITNGADIDGLLLTPDLDSISVGTGETVTEVPFTVSNDIATTTANGADYTFTIDGTEEDTGTIDVPGSAIDAPFTADVNWTAPTTTTTFPMEVCVDHPEQIGAAQCDQALLHVGGGPQVTRPTISADPTLVRQGEETELSWDPAGNTGCYFSENVPDSFDATTPGSGRIEIYRNSRFTITCPGTPEDLSASVTVEVIPTLFET